MFNAVASSASVNPQATREVAGSSVLQDTVAESTPASTTTSEITGAVLSVSKVATTDFAASTVTDNGFCVETTSPDQPVNDQPGSGTADNSTTLPEGYSAASGDRNTEPEPTTEVVNANCAGAAVLKVEVVLEVETGNVKYNDLYNSVAFRPVQA